MKLAIVDHDAEGTEMLFSTSAEWALVESMY